MSTLKLDVQALKVVTFAVRDDAAAWATEALGRRVTPPCSNRESFCMYECGTDTISATGCQRSAS